MNTYLALVLVLSLLSVALGATTLSREAKLRPTSRKERSLSSFIEPQMATNDGSGEPPAYMVAYRSAEQVERRKKRHTEVLVPVETHSAKPVTDTDTDGETTDGYTTCEESGLLDKLLGRKKKCRKSIKVNMKDGSIVSGSVFVDTNVTSSPLDQH